MKTPIAFVVFNRLDCARRTFAAIRQQRPERLFVIADGPRPHRPGDAEKCAAVRKFIDDSIDWPCSVERDYAPENLGCAMRLATGLTRAFSRAERLIILEDDCLPDPTFFTFCEELLEKYAHDTRVAQISGCPMYFSGMERTSSYVFSRYGAIWGWASWSRAWAHYDVRIHSWPKFLAADALNGIVHSRAEYVKRHRLYTEIYSRSELDSWDYQWGYAKFAQGMLSAVACRNLIENTGFGADGTHYGPDDKFQLERFAMEFPLRHPDFVIPDLAFDRAYAAADTRNMFGPPLWQRAIRKARRLMRSAAGRLQSSPPDTLPAQAEKPVLASGK